MQATVHRFEDASGSGSVLLHDGRELAFVRNTDVPTSVGTGNDV